MTPLLNPYPSAFLQYIMTCYHMSICLGSNRMGEEGGWEGGRETRNHTGSVLEMGGGGKGCREPPPPPGIFLWFAFVCFLIRSHPPGIFS